MLRDNIEGAKAEKTWVRQEIPTPVEPDGIYRLRFRVGRTGDARLLSHLEMADAWIRALRRVGAPVSYSRGFHAHARVNFSSALPVGEESTGEYMDVVLTERVDARSLFERLRATAPTGLLVLGVGEVDLRAPGLMGEVRGVDYTIFTPVPRAELEASVAALLARETFPVERDGKRGLATIDARPMLRHLSVRADGAIDLGVRSVEERPGKAKDFITLLGLPVDRTRVLRRDVFVEIDGVLTSPSAGWPVAATTAQARA
jgi:radical SAM-linked protein